MIIISIKGRLGNQMFEYALYKCLQQQGKEVYVDLACNRQNDEQRGIFADIRYNLEIFQPNYKIADWKITQEWLRDRENRNLLRRWKYRVFPDTCKYYGEKKTGIFDYNVFKMDDVYLDGYWQSEKYFLDVKDEVQKLYQFPLIYSDYQKSILEKIYSKYAVSVHIRRGDYLQHPEIYGKTDLSYYQRAIQYIEERVEDVHFFVFTDDVVWAKQHFCESNITVVENETDLLVSNMDMALMAQCKDNIITNSSYSWWGAWLNSNHKKMVIAPRVWEVNNKMTDIWCDDWIKM